MTSRIICIIFGYMAQKIGRSVSSEVVQMIKQQVTPRTVKQNTIPKSEGMFSQFEAPTLEELQDLRKTYSSKIKALST